MSERESTILVVDDYADLRDAAEAILCDAGYQVLTATDGPSAIKVADAFEGRIDVVLTDLNLPNMPGAEVAEAVRARHPEARVVYMTGYAVPQLALSGGGPAGQMMQKPFMAAELLSAIEDALQPA